ncbi:hypothetical protein [Terrabacter sp. NPDC080008]|uniref:hypothetical protein n=1 Tax=Terrabacter sp. NPDC080008 TaxID=3155176 RepID=UPI00344B6C16
MAGVPSSGAAAVLLSVTVTATTGSGYVTAYASGTTRPAISNLNYVTGQTVTNLALVPVGADGAVTLSVSGGAAQLVADVSGYVAVGPVVNPGSVRVLRPSRLLDTRAGLGAPARRVTGPAVVRLTVAGRGGVPTGASAAVLNLTAVAPSRAGYLAVTPVDSGSASTSALNFAAGRSVSNVVVARLSPTGTVDIRVSAGASVDVVADVFAAVVAGSASDDGALVPSTPRRVLDTRSGGPVAPGAAVTVGSTVPRGSAAAVVNVTVVGPSANGFVTVGAPGAGTPNVSQLTFARGATVAVQVVAPVDQNGQLRLTVSQASTLRLVVDLVGWVLGPADAQSVPGTVTTAAASPSGSALALSWTKPGTGGVTGYVIRRRAGAEAPSSPYDGIGIGTPATASFIDSRVAPGVTYSYAVFARDAAGDYSEATAVTGTVRAQSWAGRSSLPARQGSPTAVSCPTTTWCMVGDEGGAALSWNGTSWSSRVQVVSQDGNFVRGFTDVSCPSTTFCLGALTIGGYAVYRSGSWSVVPGSVSWSAVDCYSASRCALVGEQDDRPRAGFWNGTGVGSVSGPAGFSVLRSVSCPTATLCWASGSASNGYVRVMKASGTTWSGSNLASSSGYDWVEVSCTSATFCMVTSFNGSRVWRWNGSSWSRAAATTSNLIVNVNSLSCSSPTSCQGLGDGRVARWNGSTWSITELTRYVTPSAGLRNRVIDCASASMCLVVDSKGRFNRWNGSRWSPMANFDRSIGILGEVTCASPSRCMLSDYLGNVLTWNGSTWSAPTTVSESRSLLSCVSATWCLAVDAQSGTYRRWTGAWGPTTTFDNVNYYSSLACASSTVCFLFQSGHYRRYNGTSWSALTQLFPNEDGNTAVRAVCATARSCVAVDTWTGRYSVWNGSTWSKAARTGLQQVNGLSCVSASSCGAIGVAAGSGTAVSARFDGVTWRTTPTPWGPARFSCQTATRCVATGYDDSTVWMWDGLEWGETATKIQPADDIACRGTWCMATGSAGATWTP